MFINFVNFNKITLTSSVTSVTKKKDTLSLWRTYLVILFAFNLDMIVIISILFAQESAFQKQTFCHVWLLINFIPAFSNSFAFKTFPCPVIDVLFT